MRCQFRSIAWEQPAGLDYYYGAPIRVGEWLVSGGDAETLLVLQPHTGEILRRIPLHHARYPTGLAAAADHLYVTTSGDEAQCYELSSGRLLWSYQTGTDLLDMAPGRRERRSLLAAPLVLEEQVVIGGCDGRLSVLDAATGAVQAVIALGSPITAAACRVPGGFCAGSYDGRLHCFAR